MLSRRAMIQTLCRLIMSLGSTFGIVLNLDSTAHAKNLKRRVSPKATPDQLRSANPRHLDTSDLPIMPLEFLKRVGDRKAPFDAANWQLEIGGAVSHPMAWSYEDILSMPSVERNVLLICPGIFAFHGRWKGIALSHIRRVVRPQHGVKACVVYGYSPSRPRKERFKIVAAPQNELLLAYGVNGQPLGNQHGFPLRVVAPGHWGQRWTKFVSKIEFIPAG